MREPCGTLYAGAAKDMTIGAVEAAWAHDRAAAADCIDAHAALVATIKRRQ